MHMLNGLAGAFVIESNAEGGYDHHIRKFYNWGSAYGDHEKILIFQQIDPDQNLERQADTHGAHRQPAGLYQRPAHSHDHDEARRSAAVALYQCTCRIGRRRGVGNGVICPDLFSGPAAAGFQMKQTAADGVQFSPDNVQKSTISEPQGPDRVAKAPLTGLIVYAGNRVDILVTNT